ncbi:AAA family ATPase [Pseudobacter ginsenosidimutans]|uniref:AAA domain-containing protein n=1 Tax=Pseudobacter ginsenosidimutans TaxID=661488 RepID=A0A4Q7N2I9_9BACT|nr:AAA family ATPase [Pseudobacter ginsenosidimutans]QEC43678.1 AAA family ATPase [Pseudobacter ginsenosidimutans]RZS75079.1 AAA domain-containing protein [Pseudobacter ginsenosidimutans]
MRIAVVGAHRVGKSTLAEEVLANLPGYTLEMEPYYQLESSGYEFSEIPTAEDFIEQFNYSARLVSKSEGNVIFDRCIIDILAYLHVIDPELNIQLLFETAQTVMAEIDLLVFVPIEEPDLIPDHQTDLPKLRRLVNDLLHDWIWDLGIEAIEVSGTLLNRRDQVLAKIS